jgi:hypothetical protein
LGAFGIAVAVVAFLFVSKSKTQKTGGGYGETVPTAFDS